MPASWLSGGPNCVSVPDWQVHEYNDNFYILRESGCINYEKPFLYLIFGDKKALLEDTEVPVSVEDAINNVAVIEAIFNPAKSGNWESPQR